MLLALVAAVLTRFFVYPPTDDPSAADAVVVLAGDASARLPVAVRLAQEGAGVLVVSVDGGPDNAPARELCDEPGDLRVHCFTAARSDTGAEARALGDVVRDEGWDAIAVVTNSYHVARAGLLVRRCTDAEVVMVDARSSIAPLRWARALVHEVGGVAAATVERSC